MSPLSVQVRGKKKLALIIFSPTGTTNKTGMGFDAEFNELGCAPLPNNLVVPMALSDPGSIETGIFDLETTGFWKPGEVEIVQLAASFGDRNFSVYILPTKSEWLLILFFPSQMLLKS